MKLVKLATLATLSLMTLNAHALYLNKAKVTSSRTWSTGRVLGGGFTDTQENSSAGATARIASADGPRKSIIYIYGNHGWSIVNTSGATHEYLIEYKICGGPDACLYKSDNISVENNGTANNSSSSSLATYFDNAGTYDSEAITKVSGYSSAENRDTSHIYVR